MEVLTVRGSGNIVANCPGGNQIDLEVSFNTTVADPAGINLYIDNVLFAGSPFSYAGVGANVIPFTLAGDGASHTVMLEDVNDPTCTLSTAYLAPDCGATPACNLSVTATQTGGCTGTSVPFEFTISDINGGSAGFNVLIDGVVSPFSPYLYSGSGTTLVTENIVGDGTNHTIAIQDVNDSGCSAQITITTPDCTAPCAMTGLVLSSGNPILHQVEVLDFDFTPANLTISVGDTVEFFWTGQVAHTTTSDATSGPDSWNSDLLGNGSTYRVVIQTAGVHAYYCEPHGGPGGNGMSGTITATAGCTNNQVQVAATFEVANGGFNGYDILVDGSPDPNGPFAYAASGPTTGVTSVNGDGQAHTILIQDADNGACQISGMITTPDCNASVCQLTLAASQNGGCAGSAVPVEINITDVGGGAGGFNLWIDGNLVGGSPFAYDASGTTIITQNINGDGLSHDIEIADLNDASCTAAVMLTTQDCTQPCAMTGLMLASGDPVLHQVEVLDFDFAPANLTISVGDTVEFFWTGQVAHTTTSDATSGPDSWNSDLLGNGSTYRVVIQTAGVHAYYCEPHGGPGGNGMSGTITATAGCTNNQVQVAATFEVANGGFNGYDILVDGSPDPNGPFAYAASGPTTGVTSVNGDGQAHTILIQDADNGACQISGMITTPDCNASVCQLTLAASQNGGCAGSAVPVEINITDVGGGAGGFNLWIDGNLVGGSPFAYDASGTTIITQNINGDGLSHDIEIADLNDASCTAAVMLTTQDCTQPCALTNLNIAIGNPVLHVVEVLDFQFSPQDITVNVGDTVLFEWLGVIPHTTTSDANTGPLTWNSDLLGQGGQFVLIVTSSGEHLYYCEPHGGPGGNGMSGSIVALANCDQGLISANLTFNAQNHSPNGYQVFVDNVLDAGSPYPYAASNPQQQAVLLPGDGGQHALRIEDVNDSACQVEDTIQTADCNVGGACGLSLQDTIVSACIDQEVSVSIQFSIVNPGLLGYELIINQVPYEDSIFIYENGASQSADITLNGSGSSVEVTIRDVEFTTCHTTFNITLPLCGEICQILNLAIQDSPQRHEVSVADFEFVPSEINISLGDTIDFIGQAKFHIPPRLTH